MDEMETKVQLCQLHITFLQISAEMLVKSWLLVWTKLPDGDRIRVCDHERLIERV